MTAHIKKVKSLTKPAKPKSLPAPEKVLERATQALGIFKD